MSSKKKTTSKVKPPKGLKKPDQFMLYVQYVATPRALRPKIFEIEGDNDDAFQKIYKISDATLAAWKKRVDFWEAVKQTRKEFFRARTADAILALEQTAIKEGRGADVKVLLTYTDEYEERGVQEHKLHPKIEAALERIGKIIP